MHELAPTAFTQLVGVRLPLQQAAMGGVTTPALAGAVSRAGALGMIAAAGLGPEAVCAQLEEARADAGPEGRVGVSFLMPFIDERAVRAAASRASVVEFFYGAPEAGLVALAHRSGALAAWQVGSVEEAKQAVQTGCDLVIVQGQEAGGHVRGNLGLAELLGRVRTAVDLPLLAAGGIGSGAAVAEALMAGADGVRVGTRFVATFEANSHADYIDALIRGSADDTVITDTFALGWPHAPHRVLRSCIAASSDDPARRSPLPPTRNSAGHAAAAALYAGTSVAHVTRIATAADVIHELIEGAAAACASSSVSNGTIPTT